MTWFRNQFEQLNWVEAEAADDIPAFGVVEITGATWEKPNRTVLQVTQPTENSVSPFAICSPIGISNGKRGLVCVQGPVFVLYDTDETPAVGETWGPAAESFKATKGNSGLLVLGGVDDEKEIVLVNFAIAGGLVGGCLDENHPGRGTAFDIHLGTWDPADASGGKWVYDTANVVTAIDWRYDVPYPDAGTTGLFEARASSEYGIIYETVALDCSAPPEGCEPEA